MFVDVGHVLFSVLVYRRKTLLSFTFLKSIISLIGQARSSNSVIFCKFLCFRGDGKTNIPVLTLIY